MRDYLGNSEISFCLVLVAPVPRDICCSRIFSTVGRSRLNDDMHDFGFPAQIASMSQRQINFIQRFGVRGVAVEADGKVEEVLVVS